MSHRSKLNTYDELSPSEQGSFTRWLTANAILASAVAGTLVVFAIFGGAGLNRPEVAQIKPAQALPVAHALTADPIAPAGIVPVADRR